MDTLRERKMSNSMRKVRKRAKIRNQYNQVPHLTHDTNGKVTTSQIDITNESQEVSPFPAGNHEASTNRSAWKQNKTIQKLEHKSMVHNRKYPIFDL